MSRLESIAASTPAAFITPAGQNNDAAVASTSAVDEGAAFIPAGDGNRLMTRWCRPKQPAAARLLVLHGYGDHSGRFLHVMRWFAERGIACEAFDFRGHGQSSGKRGYVHRWDEYLDDLRAVMADRNLTAAGGTPWFVLGHSHGGLVAATAGVRGVLSAAGARGVVLTSPYLHPAKKLTLPWRAFAAAANRLLPALAVPTGLTADMMSADPTMVADSRSDRLLQRTATPRWYAQMSRQQDLTLADCRKFDLPLLCLVGEADTVASVSVARIFTAGVGHSDWQFRVLPGQRHELLREADRLATFEQIHQWIQAHLAAK